MSEFETVIGLEVHLQFKTKTKIFCGCANVFGETPNTHVCPVCLGLPGSLPVLNQKVLESAIKVGSALNCRINPFIKFDRKNYYYPDLPKGYQISQHDLPVANHGHLEIKTKEGRKTIRIFRAHLEEDAGKLIHDGLSGCSLVDYNRAGTPLMEIVSEPDLRTPQEAYDYLTLLKLTLQYLDVSDCDMEKGSLRCDANISIRPQGEQKLGTKVEIKNLNSFRAVKMALEHEEARQSQVILQGEKVTQETRLWSEQKGATLPMRSKEEAHDYRYFPEPDLVPFTLHQNEIDPIKNSLPELPFAKAERFLKQYSLSDYDTQILVGSKNLANFFETCVNEYPEPKKICNWITGPVLQELNTRKVDIQDLNLNFHDLLTLIQKVEDGSLSNLGGKEVFRDLVETQKSIEQIIKEKGLTQVSDEETLFGIIDDVIRENPSTAEQIRSGKDHAVGFLVGQAMKKSQGKANPKKIGELIKRRLSHG